MGLIEETRQGLLPPLVLRTLLHHHLWWHPARERAYQQVCLRPHPKKLMLRNHV